MNAKFVGSVLRVASMAAVPLAVLSMSAPASAQGAAQRELFDWRGNVDQEVRVEMQGGRASVIGMGPREMTGYDNARTIAGIPSTNGYVSVQMRQGRGNADVVQQPSAQNGYTTVVRIRDTQSGAGSYDIAAFWQPAGNYGYGDNGQYGNYGQSGNYGQYGQNGNYGQYGQYGTYPREVVVQQPVYRPVYGNRGVEGGKALPAPSRVIVNPSRTQYPGRVQNDGRYQTGNAQVGKTLPGDAQQSRTGRNFPAANQASQSGQSGQSGKALPGTNRANQQGNARPRGY